MTIRKEVSDFLSLGPLPYSDSATEHQLQAIEDALRKITRPVSREEAAALTMAFGPDECYGLAWTLLHLIESTVGGVPFDLIPESVRSNEWVQRLRAASDRKRDLS